MTTDDFFDRSKLKHIQFVRVLKTGKHARVATEFLDTIRDVDAMIVYVTLRSGLPTHQWDAKKVHVKLKERGIKIGRDRVEKAMALLNAEGWIRYVVLVKKNGQSRGMVTEVQSTRLAEDLRLGKGKIRENKDGTVSELTYNPPPPGESKSKKPRRGDAVGKKVEPGAPAVNDVSQPCQPLPCSPVDWLPGEQYKFDIIKESPTLSGEREQEVPLGQGLGPVGPKAESQRVRVPTGPVTGNTDAPEDAAAVSAPVSTPGVESVDLTKLVQLARLARDPIHVDTYEDYLRDTVFPALSDPSTPPNGKWSRIAAADWCNTSVKGRVVLTLSGEPGWPEDLARTFVKTPSKWPLSTIRLLLLTRRFLSSRIPLADIVRVDFGKTMFDQESSLGPVQQELENARIFAGCKFDGLRDEMKSFACPGTLAWDAIELRRQQWIEQICTDLTRRFPYDKPFQPSESDPRMTFEWFLLAKSPSGTRLHPSDRGDFVEVYKQACNEFRSTLHRFVASSGLAYRIVLSDIREHGAPYWGVTEADLTSLRFEEAKRLNSKAELYGIGDRVHSEDIQWIGGEVETPKSGFPQLPDINPSV